jgi:hypothetical protein
MPKRMVFFFFFLLLTPLSFAAKKKSEPDPIMADVTARGHAPFEYDQAAWHASDALLATHPDKSSLGRFIAHKSESGWTVVFGRLSEQRDKFVVAYEATQGATLKEFTVRKLDPPREDTSFYLAAAKGVETALHDFHREQRPYNVAVLPAPSGQLYVYVLPAQTKAGVYPLGGDARYLISPDGGTIVEKCQLHKSILETQPRSVPKGATPAGGFHTHVLSDVPEDTDVLYVLTREPSEPEFIGTRGGKLAKNPLFTRNPARRVET